MNNLEFGCFKKSKLSLRKINLNILISLLPLIIYACFLYNVRPILNILIAFLISLGIDFGLNKIFKDEYKLSFNLNSLILTLLLPVKISFIVLIGIIFIFKISDYFLKKYNLLNINILVLIILLYILLFDTYLVQINYKIDDLIYILINNHTDIIAFNCPFLLLVSLGYLLLTNCLKWRITLSYFITFLSLAFLVNYNYINLLNGVLLFEAIYLISNSETTPIYKISQYCFGILTAIISLLFYKLNIDYSSILAIFIVCLINPIIDRIYVWLKTK